ncbi:MAG: diadenylate cyclase [Phycisphaerae bacterium]
MIEAIRQYYETLFSEAYDRSTILIELLLIGAIVYTILRFLHGTRGARLLRGLVVLLIIGFLGLRVLAARFEWDRISVLYQSFAWTVFLTVLVIFQPELRRGLMRLGETWWMRALTKDIDHTITVIANAAALMSKSKIGAIIAIEREVPLRSLAENGVRLDARLSVDLLHTIFWPNSMLHDMGVIVSRDRIMAAGVQFPLAEAGTLDRRLGSRHRAAVGLSLESDAIVVVVSEGTGTISIAEHGRLTRGIPPEALADVLRERILGKKGAAREPQPQPQPPAAAEHETQQTACEPGADVARAGTPPAPAGVSRAEAPP